MGMKILTGCCTHIIVVLEGLWLVPLIVVQLTQPGQHAGVWWHHAYQLQEPDTTHCKHTCQPQEPNTTHRKHTTVSCRNLTHRKHTPVSCRNLTQHITNTHLSAAGTSHITNTCLSATGTSHVTNNIYQLQEPDTTHHQQSVKSCSGETSAERRYAKCWFNFNCINNCTLKKERKKKSLLQINKHLGMFSHTHMHTNTHKHTTRMMYILHLSSLSSQHNTACLEIYNQLLWFVTIHTQSLLGFLFPPPPPFFCPILGFEKRPPPPPSCATYSPHTYDIWWHLDFQCQSVRRNRTVLLLGLPAMLISTADIKSNF